VTPAGPAAVGALRALAAVAAAVLAAVPALAEAGSSPRARAVAAARAHLGRTFAGDCSGFVLGAWSAAGVSPRLAPARSRSESLFRASAPVATPRPGDLAFFHHTYDRDRDGRANDPFSHVALVEAVRGSAVTLIHRGSRGVERVRMDLSRPSDRRANDPVRALRRGEDRALRVLAGELFAGYGALPGSDPRARAARR
jgi:hypothetical protein